MPRRLVFGVSGGESRLEFHAQSVREPVHEGEIARNRTDVVNAPVIESGRPQRRDIARRDLLRRSRQPGDKFEHRPVGWIECGAPEVLGQRRGQFLNCVVLDASRPEKRTETRPVMENSIVTPVETRYGHRDHLALHPAEGAGAVHQFPVERLVQTHCLRMDAVNAENVVLILDPVLGRNGLRIPVGNERHARLLFLDTAD